MSDITRAPGWGQSMTTRMPSHRRASSGRTFEGELLFQLASGLTRVDPQSVELCIAAKLQRVEARQRSLHGHIFSCIG